MIQRWQAAEERQDRRAAVSATVMANAFRGKNSRAFTLTDFMPHVWRKGDHAPVRRKQTSQEQLEIAIAITQALGGTVNLPEATNGHD